MIMEDTPKIRFKGFTDAWEQRKLGEHCDMYNGDRSSKYPNADDMVSDGIPFINAGDLENGTVNLMTCNRISKEKYNDLGGAKLQRGDIVYCLRGTLGKNAFIDNFDEGTVASSLVVLRSKNIDGKYLYFILNSDIEYRQRIVRDEGAAQPNLSAKSVSEYIIPVPSEAEQQQVSSYFSKLDTLITLHQRKCDDTKELKKYMLQKMFPQNGKKIPEIRFAGFTGDWEQRKLGDVLQRRTEQRQQSEEYPRLAFASGQGVIPLNERKTNNREQLTKDEFTKKYLVTELDDIVYNPANVKYGAIDRNKCGRGLISPIYVTFTTSEIPGYIERIVTSHDFQQKALRFEEGTVTKRQSVNPEDLVTLDILISSQREEQKRISEYFDNLDHLIILHQRKCNELKEVKRFMLQNMFPQKG